jgi:hypothetical protein
MRVIWRRVGMVVVGALALMAAALVPARAANAPPVLPNPTNPPVGLFTATATLTMAPGGLQLTLTDVNATASPILPSLTQIIPIAAEHVTFTGLSYVTGGSNCTTGVPSEPACDPNDGHNAFLDSAFKSGAPAVLTTIPGGTYVATCGAVARNEYAVEAHTGTGLWEISFTCMTAAVPHPRCDWTASVVANPPLLVNVQRQSYSLTGTATERCTNIF